MSTRGFRWDEANGRLSIYVGGTEVIRYTTTTERFLGSGAVTFDNGVTVTAGGATITAGNLIVTAGDDRVTAGNLRLGAVSAFATTEPTSAAVFKQGTAPAGAITTSGGLFTNGTAVQKIVAAGTVSNVET